MSRGRGGGGRLVKAGVGAAAAVAAGALALKKVDERWTAADSGCEPDECLLPAGSTEWVVTDDGAKLAVTVAGPEDGPTVTLSHCWLGGREVWAPVAHRLVKAGRRVVMYDQRGHGSSSVGDDGFTIPRLGADLRAVLEEFDVRDAVLTGHSMGGMTVMSFATHHPDVLRERAKAVVLVSTGAAKLSRGKRLDRVNGKVIASPLLDRAMRARYGHALVRSSVGQSVRRRDLEVTRDFVVACLPEARTGLLAAINGMDLREGIRTIGVPTTVMVGSWDTLTPPRYARMIAEHVPGAELTVLPKLGHMLPLEAADEVAEAILARRAHGAD